MTDYFRNDVLAKRSYLREEWCVEAIAHPFRREVQPEDGRIRHWLYIGNLYKFVTPAKAGVQSVKQTEQGTDKKAF